MKWWCMAGRLLSDAPPAMCPCQASTHNLLYWKASSFPLGASSIHIPLRVSDNKYYEITQIQMVWVGVASCSATCELPLLSCSLASRESISSVSYGLIAFLYKLSLSWDIFNFHCRYIYKGERGKANWRQKIKEPFTSETEDYFSNNDLNLSTASQFSSMKRDHFKGSADFH